MVVFTNLHDPQGTHLSLIQSSSDFLRNNLPNVIVSCTEATHPDVVKVLHDLNWTFVSSGDYSTGKRAGLAKAMETQENSFFYFDLDKLLHWIMLEPEDLLFLLQSDLSCDYCLIGRDETAMSSYPDSWRLPENIINKLFTDYMQSEILLDPLASNISLNRNAGQAILSNSNEKGWSALLEWPIIARKAGLSISQITPKGMTWEDPDRYQNDINQMGYDNWKKVKYDSFEEWEKRIQVLQDLTQLLKGLKTQSN